MPLSISLSLILFSLPVILANSNLDAVLSFWSQEAGDSRRSSAIEITALGPNPSYVLIEDLGAHKFDYAGVWPSLPCFAPNGDVIIADVDSFLLQLQNPETVTLPIDEWADKVYTPSGAIILGGIPQPSTSVAVSADNKAYIINRHSGFLHAIDLDTNLPLWPPLNLSLATNGDGFKKYGNEFAFLLHGGKLWIPDPSQHGALVVSATSGTYAYTTNMDAPTRRFQGSVSSSDPQINGELVAFNDAGAQPPKYGALYGISATEPLVNSSWAWQAAVHFTITAQEFSHPVLLEFSAPGKTWSCLVSSQYVPANTTVGSTFLGGVRISGVNAKDGKVCGDGAFSSWGTNALGREPGSYVVSSSDVLKKVTWSSAPAVIPDGEGYRLYYTINLATPNTCVLYTVLVTATGVYTGSSESRKFPGLCNSAPIAMLNAYGVGKHVVAIILTSGNLHILDWNKFSPSEVDWPLAPYLPVGSTGVVFAGNYIAASSHGTILVVAHEQSINHAYLIAVVGALNGKAPGPSASPSPSSSASASPSASPSASSTSIPNITPSQFAPTPSTEPVPNNAPINQNSISPGGVAASIFGTFALLGVAASFIVFRYPSSQAAKVISSTSSAALSATKSLVKNASAAATSALSKSTSTTTLPVVSSNTPLFATNGAERSALLTAARK